MSDTTDKNLDEQIKDRLHTIFPNKLIANQIVDLVVKKRPTGWSKKSCAPYYKEIYALQLKNEIDKMITSREDIVYRYAVHCDNNNMSPQTLYNRINQSIRFLCDQLDPDDTYKNWYKLVNITREKGLGIVIRFIPEYRFDAVDSISAFKAEPTLSIDEMPLWKRQMEEWLESDSQKPFVMERLALTLDEVNKLQDELDALSTVKGVVTPTTIKIIRMNE